MSKILVIGASGFVGGRLARALLAGGHAVRCLGRDPARLQGLADILGRCRPAKVQVPRALLGGLAPLVEGIAKLPRGAVKGFVDSLGTDAVGDPSPIRAILPRPLLTFRQAAERALADA